MLEKISDEEIKRALGYESYEEISEIDGSLSNNVAQAQLDADKQEVSELFEKIEAESYPEDDGLEFYFTDTEWQALKKEILGG